MSIDPATPNDMSLFGDDSSLDHPPAQAEQKSLFNDEETAPAAKSHSSLFDDNGDGGDSPWSMPTPKKAGRTDLVKTLLPASAVPESYIDAYDALLESEYKSASGTISLAGAKQLLETSGLTSREQGRALDLVSGGHGNGVELGRHEINVLIALIGLCQEKEELSLDGVDERRGGEYNCGYDCLWTSKVYNSYYRRPSPTVIALYQPFKDCQNSW